MTSCPPMESLQRLLEGQLCEPDVSTVRAHIDRCDRCQASLDRLTDEDPIDSWRCYREVNPREYRTETALAHAIERVCRDTTFDIGTTGPVAAWALSPPLVAGDLGSIGPYRIQFEIGHGGMGIVFSAIDPALNREIAVKVLRPDRMNNRSRARFVREAQAAARVRHENVVTVHAVGNPADGPAYLVMERLHGQTLRDRIRLDRRLDPREAARIIASVADGLAAAHHAGLIHRDIKPSNIMLETIEPRQAEPAICDISLPGGTRPKLMDFGLAQIDDASSRLTQTGLLAGTPCYMSPEQARDPLSVDPRSDIYSLGATLYEVLTGIVPFDGTSAMVLKQVEMDEPRPPRQLNDAVPHDLETICLKAMAKEPQRRYGSATEMSADLRRWLSSEPIHARPTSVVERCARWCRRNPRVAGLLITVAALMVTLTAGSLFAAARIAREQAAVLRQREIAVDARVQSLVNAAPEAVPLAIERLKDSDAEVLPLLRAHLNNTALEARQRLHAAFALAAFGELHEGIIIDGIALVPASVGECTNIVRALHNTGPETRQILHHRADQESNAALRCRYAAVLLHLGEPHAVQSALQLRENPTLRTTFIQQYRTWHGDLALIPAILRHTPDAAFQSGLVTALGAIDPRTLVIALRNAIRLVLEDLYRSAPDPGTHSAAYWALEQWEIAPPLLEFSQFEQKGRDWFINRHNITMLRLAPGTFQMSEEKHHRFADRARHPVTITRPFFMSDREIWVSLFEMFLKDPNYPAEDKPNPMKRPLDREVSPTHDCPMQNVTWEEAVLFCNWLSRRENRTPCYTRVGGDSRDTAESLEDWHCQFDADGYRLPTEAEWEYACRAGTTTQFHFGDNAALLPQYVWSSNNRKIAALPGRSQLPNAWGIFDTHGNVWEWCWDWFAAFDSTHATDPRGPETPDATYGRVRVFRGGGVANFSGDSDSAARGHGAMDTCAWNLGFRVVCLPRPQ